MRLRNKIFFVWFVTFFILAVAAITTQNDMAINGSLLMITFLGFIISIDLARDSYFVLASRNWPVTKSVVKSSKSYSSRASEGRPYYLASFEIEYLVDGQRYQYEFKNPNPPRHSTEKEAEEYIRKVEAGEMLASIHYNPIRPQHSYIEPGLKVHHILGIPIGLTLVLLPILTIIGEIQWQ